MITNVKWKNHPILGDLELNMQKEGGEPYQTIVLAGENGTGKTTIMEALNNFLALGDKSLEFIDFISYTISGKSFKIRQIENSIPGFHKRIDVGTGRETEIRSNRANSFDSIKKDDFDIRKYGSVYSKARSGFSTKIVKSSSSSGQLDADNYQLDNNDDYTEIKQLLVDISTQDNADFKEFHSGGNKMDSAIFDEKHSKMQRFNYAFDHFFDLVTFKKIDHSNSVEKEILFEKRNQLIKIDDLSTGEKQVAFRGSYLLKNKENLKGGCIFIDEPELSMHPKWQRRILKFYQDLFTTESLQFAQIMLATHSEYVLESALNNEDVLVLILKYDNNGCLVCEKPKASVINYLTVAEVNYLAFNVSSIEYHNLLYGYIQKKYTSKKFVSECDDIIATHSCYDKSQHSKISEHQTWNNHTYKTLCTYIRNAIDHPEDERSFTYDELECSIELMIKICIEYATTKSKV